VDGWLPVTARNENRLGPQLVNQQMQNNCVQRLRACGHRSSAQSSTEGQRVQ
jgi:hypothetical protein